MIKTKCLYNCKENCDGIRILVTRFWPRGIKKEHFDVWLKELSPSKKLLCDYKTGEIDYQVFKDLFIEEMQINPNSIINCKKIAKLHLEDKIITLLCYEKSDTICHRLLIKNICEKITKSDLDGIVS